MPRSDYSANPSAGADAARRAVQSGLLIPPIAGGGGGGGLVDFTTSSPIFTSSGSIPPASFFGYVRPFVYHAGHDWLVFGTLDIGGGCLSADTYLALGLGDASGAYLFDLTQRPFDATSERQHSTFIAWLPAAILAAAGLVDGTTYTVGYANSDLSSVAVTVVGYWDYGPDILLQ